GQPGRRSAECPDAAEPVHHRAGPERQHATVTTGAESADGAGPTEPEPAETVGARAAGDVVTWSPAVAGSMAGAQAHKRASTNVQVRAITSIAPGRSSDSGEAIICRHGRGETFTSSLFDPRLRAILKTIAIVECIFSLSRREPVAEVGRARLAVR